jgi:hypothetical protein
MTTTTMEVQPSEIMKHGCFGLNSSGTKHDKQWQQELIYIL